MSVHLIFPVLKVILSLLMGMIKYCQSTQSNEFALSLQYLRKEVRDSVNFLVADKYQRFYKLTLSFLMEAARHIQGAQNKNFVIFLQYLKKKVLQMFYLNEIQSSELKEFVLSSISFK